MFLAHYGAALAAKQFAPRTSLGTLVLAAQLADEIWPALLLTGLEKVNIVPGLLAASPFDFVHYPYTHSLLTGLLAGVLFAVVYYLFKKDLRGALTAGALVPSHWLLDFAVHRPDLPLYPGGPKLGLGLWGSLPMTLSLEALLFGAGLWFYTRIRPQAGRQALWAFAAVLTLLYAASELGPPPPDAPTVAWSSLTLWLFVAWAYWIDRKENQ